MATLQALDVRSRLDAQCHQRSRPVAGCVGADRAPPRRPAGSFAGASRSQSFVPSAAGREARAHRATPRTPRARSSGVAPLAPPSDAELQHSAGGDGGGAAAGRRGRPTDRRRGSARRLAEVLERLQPAAPDVRAAAAAAVVAAARRHARSESARCLQAGPVTLETLPADIVADWIAKDGRARIQVLPQRRPGRRRSLWRFARGDPGRSLPMRPACRFRSARPATASWRPSCRPASTPLVAITLILAAGAAAGARRDADHGAGAAERPSDLRDLRGPRPAAELRQHHRPAAAVRRRRRLQHLLRAWRGAPARRRCCSRA